MSKLAKLRQTLAAKKASGRALIEAAEGDERDLTADEATKVATLQAEVKDLEGQIAAAELKEEQARAFADDGLPEPRRVAPQARNAEEERRGGFRNTAEFALCVREAGQPGGAMDPRLANLYRPAAAPADFQQESGGTSGEGYLVPPAMRDGIWELALAELDLLGLADPDPTSRTQVDGIADETTPWGSAGIQAYWRAEGTKMDPSKAAQDPRTTRLHELYALVLATGELLQDAPLLNSRIERGAARAIGWTASDAIMWGNASGKPLGFMKSNALITVAKESGQSNGTIVAMNVLKMLSRLLMTPGARPLWLINSQCIPQIATLTIGDQPMYIPQGGITEGLRASLLGYPILFTEHATALGQVGDISLVDMQGYEAYRRSSGPDFATSMHLYFDYNIEAFRWIFRFGGQPYLSKAVAGAKSGADSKSHFVTLAKRAA